MKYQINHFNFSIIFSMNNAFISYNNLSIIFIVLEFFNFFFHVCDKNYLFSFSFKKIFTVLINSY